MKMFRGFSSSSLRFKILFGLLLSLLPMLAIMGISYYSARNTALENSERIMKLISQYGAQEINGFIKVQESVFLDWTKEDVFGMAIEFQTTKELQGHFKLILKGQQGFSLLMLTDKNGKVLEAAVGDNIKGGNPEAFKGRSVKEASGLMNKAIRCAGLVESDFIKQLGQSSAHTFLFSFKAKDSEGKPNGLFLAYLDWSNLQSKVIAVFNEMETNGFNNAEVAILDVVSTMVLGHSNDEMISSRLEMADALQSWLRGFKGGEVRKFDLGEEIDYITFVPIQKAAIIFEGDITAQTESNLCLASFVPEGDIISKVHRILWTSTGIAVGGALLIVLIGFFIARLISKPLNRVIEGLNEGADQVASASGQVSSSSQSLAEGSSEQAASIEETSSSLEEMSSMTKQNAENAHQADGLMKEANQVVGQANDSMGELTTSMVDISKASEETSKIIKTIDEIAFQTNLLALNAAVEAARAGEAGAGFAVVADEVRNLAMRAADAAKNTADLIEGTVKKVKDGSELVTQTNEAFGKVAESASKVGELVAEIAAASNEQAQGIDQTNKAVAEMDKVVQQNAANAEESTSASNEMNAQAEQMKGMVGQLVALVGGSAKGAGNGPKNSIRNKTKTEIHKALPGEIKAAKGKEVAAFKSKEVAPQQVIPMDDDFKNF